jgi:hypothetical protein
MDRHYGQLIRGLLWLAVFAALVLPLIAAPASAAVPIAQEDAAPAGPDAAPNPPEITIVRQGTAIRLNWQHSDSQTARYEIWRSENPYLGPAAPATKVGSFYFTAGIYGVGASFSYVDNGSCGYFIAAGQNLPCQAQNPSVTVVGDKAHNYFWIVSAGNASSEYAHDNHVGEFDFGMTPGN